MVGVSAILSGYKLIVRHWQWFLLSVTVCLCLAFLYTKLVTPVYKISGRMIIKSADKDPFRSSNRMLSNVQNVGTVSNSLGVENEVERIWSSMLMRDVVKQLKLYVEYQEKDGMRYRDVYGRQPVSVDIDPLHLDSLDLVSYDEFRSITMHVSRQSDTDTTWLVKGVLSCDDEAVWAFSRRLKSLPASIKTPYGTLIFTRNLMGKTMTAGSSWQVTIVPPIYQALVSLGRLSVVAAANDYYTDRGIIRYFYKLSSIVNVSYLDKDVRRGMDIIRQLAIIYNRQANDEKNEIALRTEAFINKRISQIVEDLGNVDDSIVDIKRQGRLTSLREAALAVKGSDQYSSMLTEATSQAMIIDELETYIADPANNNTIIPSSIGLNDKTAEQLINKHNNMVQQRNRLLKSVSENAIQVQRLTAMIDETRRAVLSALQQIRHTAQINNKAIRSQYSGYREHVSNIPVTERALAEVNRERLIKARLFTLLLQKREENSIALSSTADQGRLIDEPICEGRVKPKLLVCYGIALGAGLAIPYALLIVMGLLRYKVENHEELTRLTDVPIIADVPMVKEASKEKNAVVVRDGMNRPIDEAYRLMRTNLYFMMKSDSRVILFTSTSSGEGKTFNAANLAMSYAILDKRVVLCGLDIRKPALGRLFGLPDVKRGISVLLPKATVTEADVQSQLQPSGVDDRLDLLLAGPEPPNPTELLNRDSFRQTLDILRRNYDMVILDTAPVGLVTDTFTICKHADVTIYVCRANQTPRYAIAQLNAIVEEKKFVNPCIVFNGCRET